MTEPRSDPSRNAPPEFDLSRFHQAFFEEAGENLAEMETLLLSVDGTAGNDDRLNAIFRCAHSVKGGAATFGFGELAELSHAMETLLDRVRRHEIALAPAMVDVLLEAGDLARAQLELRRQGGGDDEAALSASTRLRARLAALSGAALPAPTGGDRGPRKEAGDRDPPANAAESTRTLLVTIGPLTRPQLADSLAELFDEIPELGSIRALDEGLADELGRRVFEVRTPSSDEELLDLFGFHVAREDVAIRVVAPEREPGAAGAGAAPALEGDDEPGFGLFAGPPTAEPGSAVHAPTASAATAARVAPGADASTLRVPVSKIDTLINLVGELVIGQSMLAQASRGDDGVASEAIRSCLSELERNTRQLQEAVMAVRMIPVATVFMRFPRMLRDLAARLDKQVELHTVGESTELDKGMIEKIIDPLTHLVRNALDHGIEAPAERVASAKPACGSITLSAAHHGGSIVIEVSDDGRGLDRDRIVAKARALGIAVQDSASDQDVHQLLFAPGFSTVDEVTEISGRGVGLDVVRQNILSLGGSVALDSAPGYGTRVTVRLPLTLAIMDGMLVDVGGEVCIVPLAAVVESFRLAEKRVRSVTGTDRVVEVRGEFVPVIALDEVYGVAPGSHRPVDPIMVVIESDGSRIAILVDALVGQHQIVVKNLETNYRQVPGVSAATILGDGKVALIIDVAYLVHRTRH